MAGAAHFVLVGAAVFSGAVVSGPAGNSINVAATLFPVGRLCERLRQSRQAPHAGGCKGGSGAAMTRAAAIQAQAAPIAIGMV